MTPALRLHLRLPRLLLQRKYHLHQTTFQKRTMSTTTNNPPTTSDAPPTSNTKSPLPLPAPPTDSTAPTLDVSTGQAVKLDHLGPMVVNRDGTLSRIANWAEMSEIERGNTLRILGKRNALRLEGLKAAEGEGDSSGEGKEGK